MSRTPTRSGPVGRAGHRRTPGISIARMVAAAALAGCALLIVGCAGPSQTDTEGEVSDPSTTAEATYGPDVVHFGGVGELRFGDTERELADRGVVVTDNPGCAPTAKYAGAGPVFVDGKLALVWADPPLRTPEGVTVGSSVTRVRQVYPSATVLTAPQGSHRLDGLLAGNGDRAYLFLHDGRTVAKVIVGYEAQARRLFQRGFAGC